MAAPAGVVAPRAIGDTTPIAWRTVARSVRRTRPRSGVAVVLAAAVVLASGIVGPMSAPVLGIAEVSAQQRSVVVVSDSILTGAQAPLSAQLRRLGWSVTFDGEVSRSTIAGASVVSRHAGELTDSLVVSLGANDSGNPATFAQRVEAVMASAGTVPNVYWLTIREVRPYYGPANRVLRDAAARHQNLHLIDWNAASAGRNDLTVGDGLHLSGNGSTALASLVVGSLTGSVAPTPAAPAHGPQAGQRTPDPAPVADTVPVAGAAPVVPTPTPAEEPAPGVTGTAEVSFERSLLSAPLVGTSIDASGGPLSAESGPDGWVRVGHGSSQAPAVVLFAVMAALIALVVAARRIRNLPLLPVISGPVLHSAITRSELRRARIAEARTRHPAACPSPPPVPDNPDLVGSRS